MLGSFHKSRPPPPPTCSRTSHEPRLTLSAGENDSVLNEGLVEAPQQEFTTINERQRFYYNILFSPLSAAKPREQNGIPLRDAHGDERSGQRVRSAGPRRYHAPLAGYVLRLSHTPQEKRTRASGEFVSNVKEGIRAARGRAAPFQTAPVPARWRKALHGLLSPVAGNEKDEKAVG